MSDPSNLYLLTEAAERTGLTVDALRKRILKGKLERVKGNDGLVRVRLTTADMEALKLGEGQAKPSPSDENGQTIKALEAEAAALRERAAKAEGESATLRERMESERARADRAATEWEAARAETAVERARAAQAEREREAAKVAAASAEGEAKGLRLALEEARRPLWRRWLG
jgi:chromosome segregation ATPase